MLFQLWEYPRGDQTVFRKDGHVVVASHQLAKEVLTDASRFSAGNALDAITDLSGATMRELAKHRFRLPPTMANNATESHPRLRSTVAEAFHPAKVASLRPWLTGLVRRQMVGVSHQLRTGRTVDLDTQISAEIPLVALGHLLGLPSGSTREVKRFSRAALEMFWGRPDTQRQLELARIIGPYHARLRSHVQEADVGTMAKVRDDFSEDQATAALFFLLVAGQETTAQFITLLLHRLMSQPEVLQAVQAGQAAEVVEEGLRLFPSIVSWRRVAKTDCELDGMSIAAGESILVWLAAAGRDPAITECPERLVPGQRGSRKHVAFGAGAHRCLGSQLTRLEAEIVLSEVAPLLRRCQVVTSPVSPENVSFRMPGPFTVSEK